MELYALQVFLTVATEKSFSRAADRLLRTQPAVSLSLQRLEAELGEKLIDRSAKDLVLTDAGRTVLDYARRFDNLRLEMENSLAELRDNSAGTLTVGANESSALYLLRHIKTFRRLHPKINVRVRRSLSSKIPNELLDGNLELGVISYDPPDERLTSTVIYTDALAFVVSPKHPTGAAGSGIDFGPGGGNVYRAQCAFAVPRRGAARIPAAAGAAEYARGNAHYRDDPQDGAE